MKTKQFYATSMALLLIVFSHTTFASIEFHLALCGHSKDDILNALTFGPKTYEQRSIYYFDTKKLDLLKEGVILRGRLLNKSNADLSIKLRPFLKSKLTSYWVNHRKVRCELDHYHNNEKLQSCQYKSKTKEKRLKNAAKNIKIEKLVRSKHKDFIQDNKDLAIDTDQLYAYGPALVEKYRNLVHDEKWVLEFWKVKKQTIIELSFKSSKKNFKEMKDKILKVVHSLKLKACINPTSKTKMTLRAFQTVQGNNSN